MEDYITANEARERSKSNITYDTKMELKCVYDTINLAINKGEFSCEYFSPIHEQSKKILSRNGFTVTNHTNVYDGDLYRITW